MHTGRAFPGSHRASRRNRQWLGVHEWPDDCCAVGSMSTTIRSCRRDESATILTIINAAAEAYRGVIPDDCWHEPYMSLQELESEIAVGVAFSGYYDASGQLIGVMGLQPVADVDLIRHAYVLPGNH